MTRSEILLALRAAGAKRIKLTGSDVDVEFGELPAPRIEVSGPSGPITIPDDVAALLALSPEERAARILAPGERRVPRNLVGLWQQFLAATDPGDEEIPL